MTESHNTVSKEELLNELLGEREYHRSGRSDYRQKTTELAFDVANKVNDVSLFFDRKETYNLVSKLLSEDEHRLADVAKMLSVVTRDLHLKKTYPPEMEAYLREMKKNAKPLALIK